MRTELSPPDALGQRFAAAGTDARIASLAPSLTETVFALGLGAQLVARTGFCIHPDPAVRAVPKVGGTKDVNLDKLRALRPTHALVNVDENTRETVQALRAFVPHIVVTHPLAPADNPALLRLLAGVFAAVPGVTQTAAALGDRFGALLADLAAQRRRAGRALYLIWRQPWMTVARDTYIAASLRCAGWDTLPAVTGGDGLHGSGAARYPRLDWDAPWLAEVDWVLLSTEPYRFTPAHVAEVRQILAARGLHPRVELVDGEWASWWGVRALIGLPQLAALAQRR